MKRNFLAIRPHFLCSVAMFIFISMIVIEKSYAARAMLLVPVVTLFLAFQVLYSLEVGASDRKKDRTDASSRQDSKIYS